MRTALRMTFATAIASCLLANAARADTPITPITKKMTGVSGELKKTKTGEPVQEKQKEIIRDLDELIAALEKQCAACRGAGRKPNNPTRGMADSMISGGSGGIGALVAPGESNKDWAKLSPRERDRILQSMTEGFPPEYRTVLERYYRRLAEEKTVSSGANRPKPKETAPSSDKP